MSQSLSVHWPHSGIYPVLPGRTPGLQRNHPSDLIRQSTPLMISPEIVIADYIHLFSVMTTYIWITV